MITAVADAGPIIHLDEIDALSVLSVLDNLLVPRTVLAELEAGAAPPALDELEYELVNPGNSDLDADLDPGETAALAITKERNAVLLTDDLAARDALMSVVSRFMARSASLRSPTAVVNSRNRTRKTLCVRFRLRRVCT